MSTDEPAPQPSRTFTVTTAPPTTTTTTAAPVPVTTAWPPADEHLWLTFPPFPQAPPGVTLIPFSAFKPAGVLQAADGERERDALGIPTVALRVHHDLTAMEKRKRKKTRTDASGAVRRVLWFEDWADGEELRRSAGVVDPSLPRIDRLHQAAYDFKHGRSLASNQEINHLWDRWRLYTGLISGMQAPATRKKNSAMRDAFAAMADAPADDDDDDDEDMPATRPPKEASVMVSNDEDAPPPSLPPSQPKPGVTEEQRQQRREYYREVRDQKMDRFLNDPEKAVKIFLSGYYRDRGLSFSEKSCRDGPILLAFFLNFLLRNRVFPESDKQLRKAVAVAELAQKELPHSFVISRGVPDAFSRGCEHLFGTMTDSWQIAPADPNADAESGDEGAPGAKRQKTEASTEAAVLQEALGPAEIEVVTDDTMHEMEEAAKEAGVDGVQDEPPAWGAPDAAAAAAPPAAGEQSWGDPNAEWGAPNDPLVWDMTPKPNSLHEYVGATALPLTHTTGVVERSTRRVKAVIPPRAQQKKSGKNAKGQVPAGPTPEGVERDLEARLAQVVLAPWEEWDAYDKADVTKPTILSQSRGPAIKEANGEPQLVPTVDGALPHNPFKDEITLLADPAVAETLWVGTGLEATWVQLARTDPSVHIEAGGLGDPVAPTKFWYMEQVLAVLPTFHTEMVPLPTTQDVFGEEAS